MRAIAPLLVMLALLMRVAIPAGWMPAADGSRTITLCTGMGVQLVTVGADGRIDKHAPAKADRDHPCAFAAAAAAIDAPAAAPSPLLSAAPAAPVAAPSFLVAIGRGLAAPPPPQTGPPAILRA